MLKRLLLLLVLILILAGCANSVPAQVVEQYLQARITSDVDQLRSLSCAEWESQVILEANSFQGRDAELRDMSCTADEPNGDEAIVHCTGTIIVVYEGEENEFPLTNYRVMLEDEEWKMCGEAE